MMATPAAMLLAMPIDPSVRSSPRLIVPGSRAMAGKEVF